MSKKRSLLAQKNCMNFRNEIKIKSKLVFIYFIYPFDNKKIVMLGLEIVIPTLIIAFFTEGEVRQRVMDIGCILMILSCINSYYTYHKIMGDNTYIKTYTCERKEFNRLVKNKD